MFTHKALTSLTEKFSKLVATLAVVAMIFAGSPVSAIAAIPSIATYSDAACTTSSGTFTLGSTVYVGGTNYTGPAGTVLQWDAEPVGDANVGGPVAADGTFCIGTHVIGATEAGTYSMTVTQSLGDDSNTANTNYNVPLPLVDVTTLPATGISSSDATLNGLNGDNAAIGHSFWVSTSTFSTASPSIPTGVYSTPDFGAIAANTPFSALLSLVTTSGIPSNMSAITASTTYYFAAWSNSGTWHPGEILSFMTLPGIDTTAPTTPVHVSPADNSTLTAAALTEIQWTDSTDTETPPVTYIYQSSNSSSTNPDGSFVTPAYTSGALTTSQIVAGGTPEGVYYWHVKAFDSAAVPNSSPWTDAWKITVDNSATTTSTSTGAIVVNKIVLDPSGATTTDSTTFTFKLDGTITATGSDTSPAVFSGMASSTYILTEDALAGYDLVSITPSSTVSVGENSTTTITVVNQQQATSTASTTATITIHKVTNPGSHNTDFSFSLNQGTTTVATTTANASTGDGSFTNVAPGTYKIVEGDTALWAFTSVSCTGGAPIEDTPNHAINVMVEAGDNITCTFTNTAENGIVHVTKQILASDGSTAATYDYTLFGVHAVGFDGTVGQFNGGATSTSLMAGSYTLTEDANADYDLVSITSNTNASTTSGEFTVSNGTTTEIVVVNQQHASSTGKIIVHKAANPSDINASFAFNLEHGTTFLGTGTTTGTSTIEFNNLPHGTYKLTEVQVPGWNYNGATCVYNGGSAGSEIPFGKTIYLNDNYVVDCTFTNTSTTGTIRVVKNVIDSNNVDISDTHAFSVTLNGTSTKSIAEGSDALYTGLTVSESLYTIAENSDSGYDLVSITASSTVSVAAGTTTVVTITNRKHAAPVETSGGGGGGGGFGPTGYATPPLTTGGSVLGASTDTSGGTGTTGGNNGNTGNIGTTYYPRGASSFDGSGPSGGGSTFLAQDDASTTDATTTDLVQMPSEEEMNQLAAAGATASGAVIGSWFWWLLLIIILAILYYIYRRSKQA